MNVDNTTLNDLSIFAHEEEQSVFHHINFTRTIGGKDWLRYFLAQPLPDIKSINERQVLLQRIASVDDRWPIIITNGTVMVMEKFYEQSISEIPHKPSAVDALVYSLFNGPDFSLVKYSDALYYLLSNA